MKACQTIYLPAAIAFALSLGLGNFAQAQDNSEDLAKKLSNPVASLISVPFQFNYDEGFGPDDGQRAVLNIQPVIPISLNDNWTMISRTILPVIWQNDIAGPSGEQSGVGDITQSLFFSPKTRARLASSGASARCFWFRAPPTTYSAAASGALVRPPWS